MSEVLKLTFESSRPIAIRALLNDADEQTKESFSAALLRGYQAAAFQSYNEMIMGVITIADRSFATATFSKTQFTIAELAEFLKKSAKSNPVLVGASIGALLRICNYASTLIVNASNVANLCACMKNLYTTNACAPFLKQVIHADNSYYENADILIRSIAGEQ